MFRYLLADLRTGRLLDEVQCAESSWTTGTVRPGTYSTDILLHGATPERIADIERNSTPARTALYIVNDDNNIEWSGIIWSRSRNTTAMTFSIECAELISYLDHIYITDDLVFTDTDQALVARALVNYAQTKPGGNIGIVPDDGGYLSGATVNMLWERVSGKTVRAALEELADLPNGPETRIDVQHGPSGLTRRLLVGTPRLGRPFSETGFTVQIAATDGITIEYAESGADTTNAAYVMGSAPEGEEAAPIAHVWNTDAIDVRLEPRLESWESAQSVTDTSLITSRAAATVNALVEPVVTGSITRPHSAHPGARNILPGDEVLVRSDEGAFAAGLTWLAVIEAVTTSPTTQTLQVVGIGTLRTPRPSTKSLFSRLRRRLTDLEAAVATRGRTVAPPAGGGPGPSDMNIVANGDFTAGIEQWFPNAWDVGIDGTTRYAFQTITNDHIFAAPQPLRSSVKVPMQEGQTYQMSARVWIDNPDSLGEFRFDLWFVPSGNNTGNQYDHMHASDYISVQSFPFANITAQTWTDISTSITFPAVPGLSGADGGLVLFSDNTPSPQDNVVNVRITNVEMRRSG